MIKRKEIKVKYVKYKKKLEKHEILRKKFIKIKIATKTMTE